MKTNFLTVILVAVFYLQSFSQTTGHVEHPKQWMEQRFAKGVVPPFSFVYGGKKSDSFIKNWQYQSEKIPSTEPNQEKYVYSYSDKATGLVVKCTVACFTDFPAVEWVLHFSNTSKKNTPLIEKVAVVDHSFNADNKGTFMLHHHKGTTTERSDFQPFDEQLQIGKPVYMTPVGGLSSHKTAFPFFNIAMPDGGQGIIAAVGWTGKWYADVTQTDAQTVNLKSGMEKMQLTLYHKEEIRTPKICLLFWKGEDRMVGHNQFRQLILAHYSPKINGKFAEFPLSAAFNMGDDYPCEECVCHTEEYCIAAVKRYRQYNMVPEVFWLDAGWYDGCGWNKEKGGIWENMDMWAPDKERFPNGLKPVADAIHEAGAKFLVWFCFQWSSAETTMTREHSNFLYKKQDNQIMFNIYNQALINLGNKDARTWLTDHISSIIKKEGIDIFRTDGSDPYEFWIENDQPGRIGMSEIRYIEGLYAVLDSLLVRFPDLQIDNCSGGGTRIDLEMTSRSAPLWRTDHDCYMGHNIEAVGKQCHTYALNFYLPIHGTYISTNDKFIFRSGLGTAAIGEWLKGHGRETVEVNRRYMQEFKELRPYFYGDYYPLTFIKDFTSDGVWLAYQLNRPQQKDGIIIAFRRSQSPDPSIRIKLSGLEKDALYELFYEDDEIRTRHTGSELMNGFDITLPTPRTSLLIKYQKIK